MKPIYAFPGDPSLSNLVEVAFARTFLPQSDTIGPQNLKEAIESHFGDNILRLHQVEATEGNNAPSAMRKPIRKTATL